MDLSEAGAAVLDAADPLSALRDRFEMPRREDGTPLIYLCGHSLGPMPRDARTLVEAELETWSRLGVDGWFREPAPWLTAVERLADATGRIVGASPHEVVTMNGLTVNLHLLFATFYRPTPERYAVLMERDAFPSDRYAVEGQVRHHGLDPAATIIRVGARRGENLLRTEDIEAVIRADGRRIALVWLPGVQFLTGQRLDIERITAAARERGALAGWDLAHAAGNVPLRLHDWDVDLAVWCTYKYLNGGPGAVGQAFVHERHARNAELPRLGGWWGNAPGTRMEMREPFEPRPEAAGWLVSTPPILALAPLRASLELFEEAGMAALRERSMRLTTYLEAQLDAVGIRPIITPRDPEERGAQLSIRVRDAAAVQRRLAAAGAIVDDRPPDLIRVAPAPLYSTFAEVRRFAQLFAEVVEGGAASAPRPSPDEPGQPN
jgi:kynureninase